MMHSIVEDFSVSPLLKAMEANVHEAWMHLGRGLGAVIHDEPELLWFHSGLPFHLANGIVRTHFPPDTVEEAYFWQGWHSTPLQRTELLL